MNWRVMDGGTGMGRRASGRVTGRGGVGEITREKERVIKREHYRMILVG